MYRIALLPGDGIGPEVTAAARAALEASGAPLVFDEIPCGGRYFLEHGSRDWPEDAEARTEAADALLLGAVGWPDPRGTGPVCLPDGRMAGWSAVLGLRARFDLYANVRPVRLYPGVRTRIAGRFPEVWRPEEVDLLVVRENTEDLYYGAGGVLRRAGVAELATDTRVITRRGTERVVRFAFAEAEKRQGRVAAALKHNVLDGCRLFAEVFAEVAAEHPGVFAELVLVDAAALALVTDPARFDVLVAPNLFGDILTDLSAVLQGGLGLAVGANLGEGRALFEPVHGSAPDLAGRGLANPLAAVLAAAALLRWLGRTRGDPATAAAGRRVEAAVMGVLAAGSTVPVDLGGDASTEAVTAAVCGALEADEK